MTAPIDSVLAKFAARRGFIAPEIAERLLREAKEQGEPISRNCWSRAAGARRRRSNCSPRRPPSTASHLIGGYQLVSKLGQGGMGVVYQATQLSMQRTLALKVLGAHLVKNREFAERFLREAHAAGRVVHPNVIGCHDAGEDGGHLFMALQYVAGGDADRLLKEHGRLPERRALEIARDCAAGLEALHAAGLIHRDIKPGNISLDLRGQAKLGDLGLARSLAGEDRLTMTGTAIGTPAFMSPEQANGDADLDIRSDLYSFGASLFQLLTGEPPYRGNSSWAVVAKAINEPFPDPRTFRSDISDAAASVVLCAAAKDRAKRHPTPTALREDLELLLVGQGPRHAPLVRSPSGAADPSLATVVLAPGGKPMVSGTSGPRRQRPRAGRNRVESGRAGLWIGLGLLALSVAVVVIVLRHGRERRKETPPPADIALAERLAAAPVVVPVTKTQAPESVTVPVAAPSAAVAPMTAATPASAAPAEIAPALDATEDLRQAPNIIFNGDFEMVDGGLPRDWELEGNGISLRGTATNRWLTITRSPGKDQPTATGVATIPMHAPYTSHCAPTRQRDAARGRGLASARNVHPCARWCRCADRSAARTVGAD